MTQLPEVLNSGIEVMVFRDVRQPVYSDSCCHLNLTGNEIMARAIGEAIASDLARDSTNAPAVFNESR